MKQILVVFLFLCGINIAKAEDIYLSLSIIKTTYANMGVCNYTIGINSDFAVDPYLTGIEITFSGESKDWFSQYGKQPSPATIKIEQMGRSHADSYTEDSVEFPCDIADLRITKAIGNLTSFGGSSKKVDLIAEKRVVVNIPSPEPNTPKLLVK